MIKEPEAQSPAPGPASCVDHRSLHTAVSGLAPLHGVHIALVVDIIDPENIGRVCIALPWAPDVPVWARVATLMAGPGRGTWFMPDVDDEVLVAFEAGDAQRPFVLGSLWNGRHTPPQAMDGSGRNEKKVIRSTNGVTVTLDDAQGQERFVCETPSGQRITLHDGDGAIRIEGNGAIEIEGGNGASVHLDGPEIRIDGGTVKLTASFLQVEAGMARFSGVLQCDTLISNTVVSSTYTPGAGNVW